MLAPAEPAPDDTMNAAAALAAVALDDPQPEIASFPIPIHRIRHGAGPNGWDPVLPRVGWAIPAFRDGELAFMAVVRENGESSIRPASSDTDLGDALRSAAGIAETAPGPASLRMVEADGISEAFWIEWTEDTFVLTGSGLVVSGPEFARSARQAAGEHHEEEDYP